MWGGGIKGSVKGGCWRSWWGNKGQCERWVLEGEGSAKGGAKGWVLDVFLRGG